MQEQTNGTTRRRFSRGARLVMAAGALQKLVGALVIFGGLALAVRALVQGDVVFAIVTAVIAIPIVLWGVTWVAAIIGVVVFWPLSIILRARNEFAEFSSLQVAIAEVAGGNDPRMTLRASRVILEMYEQLPPPPRGVTRSPAELVAVAEEVGGDLRRFGGTDDDETGEEQEVLNIVT